MSVLVVHICSYGPVRRHDLCQSSWSTSVLTALSDVMSQLSSRGPNLFVWPCQTSCLMSVLFVHICSSLGSLWRHDQCHHPWICTPFILPAQPNEKKLQKHFFYCNCYSFWLFFIYNKCIKIISIFSFKDLINIVLYILAL